MEYLSETDIFHPVSNTVFDDGKNLARKWWLMFYGSREYHTGLHFNIIEPQLHLPKYIFAFQAV